MSVRRFGLAFLLSALLGCSTSQVSMEASADEKATQAQQAIEKAETELAAAEAADSVWQLIDPATGSSSVSLDKLLAAAKMKQEAGEFDEAIRIADRVAEAAMLGVEQAESQKGAKPFYN